MSEHGALQNPSGKEKLTGCQMAIIGIAAARQSAAVGLGEGLGRCQSTIRPTMSHMGA